MASFRTDAPRNLQDKKLDAFSAWMVKQNLEYARKEGLDIVVSRLRSQGYSLVADEVTNALLSRSRIRDLDFSRVQIVNGIACVIVPRDCKTGGFTKPLTKVLATPEEAMQAALDRGSGGDKLIARIRPVAGHRKQLDGWQVWQRRAKVGGRKRVCTPTGSHAISVNVGCGAWFIDEA